MFLNIVFVLALSAPIKNTTDVVETSTYWRNCEFSSSIGIALCICERLPTESTLETNKVNSYLFECSTFEKDTHLCICEYDPPVGNYYSGDFDMWLDGFYFLT